MTASIQRRLNKIKALAKEYYGLAHGAPVINYTELLRFFDIRGSIHANHPHKGMRVYMTRRALKHCIESRKEELCKNHTDLETMELLKFAIDNIQETVTNFSSYIHEPPSKFIYIKNYSHSGKPLLRIVIDFKENSLQIKSIHFRKNKKKGN